MKEFISFYKELNNMNAVELVNTSNNFYGLLVFFSKNIVNPGEMLKGLPIPPSHIKVIFHLSKSGPSSVSEIANVIDIFKPNMTPIIDKLTSEGYVRRFNDVNDRRIIMIEITNKATELLESIEIKIKKVVTEKISILSVEELEELDQLTAKMKKVLNKLV